MTLGSRLRKEREKKKLTQEELGKLLGVSDATINRYEKDTRKPDPTMLKALANILEVTTDFLLGRPVAQIEKKEQYHIPPDILRLASDPGNYAMLRRIKKAMQRGRSTDIIEAWISSLDETMDRQINETLKKYGFVPGKNGRSKVFAGDDDLTPGEEKLIQEAKEEWEIEE